MKKFSDEWLKAFELAEKILRTNIVPEKIDDEFNKNKNLDMPIKARLHDAIITVVQKKAKQQKRSEMDILTDFEKIVDKKSTTGSSDDDGGLEFKYKDKSKSGNNIKQHSTGKNSVKNTTRSTTNTSSATSRNTTSTTISTPISVSCSCVPELDPTEEDEEEFEF